MAKQRLQRILAAAGVASRRKCEELIEDGAVRVNRNVVDQLPAFADPDIDVITVNGKRVFMEDKVYYLLNKPSGYICTSSDPEMRKKALDLVPATQRVFCVGRLDADTSGAIILTNDSELCNRLTHPRYELPKTYEVCIKGRLEENDINKLKKGVWLSEGRTERSAIKIIHRSHSETIFQMVIRQGMNRQVRRMLARLGFNVKKLRRSQIGNITLKGIGVGKFRLLSSKEVSYLKRTTSDKSIQNKSKTEVDKAPSRRFSKDREIDTYSDFSSDDKSTGQKVPLKRKSDSPKSSTKRPLAGKSPYGKPTTKKSTTKKPDTKKSTTKKSSVRKSEGGRAAARKPSTIKSPSRKPATRKNSSIKKATTKRKG